MTQMVLIFLVGSGSAVLCYPTQNYLLNMDSTSGAVLCYEIWCYYSGDDGTIGKGWVMGIETGHGPYLTLNDSVVGGISMFDNNTYSSSDNPGYITSNDNKSKLLHIIGYYKQVASNNHERGVYINGTHHPQETTSQSGKSNYPGFDTINWPFTIGGHGNASNTANLATGVRIYSFRIWHGDIRSKASTLYNAGPHAYIDTGISSWGSSLWSSLLTYFTPLTYQKPTTATSISLTESETAMLQIELLLKQKI